MRGQGSVRIRVREVTRWGEDEEKKGTRPWGVNAVM